MKALRALMEPLQFMLFIMGLVAFIGGMIGFFMLPVVGYYGYAMLSFIVWFIGAVITVRFL